MVQPKARFMNLSTKTLPRLFNGKRISLPIQEIQEMLV